MMDVMWVICRKTRNQGQECITMQTLRILTANDIKFEMFIAIYSFKILAAAGSEVSLQSALQIALQNGPLKNCNGFGILTG